MTNNLKISWAISRGRDTYGYNICRLDSWNTGKRYRCSGGGYDMVGTVFGKWLAVEHQEALKAFFINKKAELVGSYGGYWKHPEFYGGHIDMDSGCVILEGACGIDCMIHIAESCGLKVQREYIHKGRLRGQTIGYGVINTQPTIGEA